MTTLRRAALAGIVVVVTSKQLDAFGWPHERRMHDGGRAIGQADASAAIAFARDVVANGCRR